MQTHTFVLGGSEWAREEWLQTHIWKDLAFQKGLDLRDQPYHLWSFQSDKCLALEKYGCPLDVSGEHHPHCNLVPLPMNSADPDELFSTGLPFCYSSLAFSLVSKVVISYLLHIPLTPPLLLGDAPPSAPKKKNHSMRNVLTYHHWIYILFLHILLFPTVQLPIYGQSHDYPHIPPDTQGSNLPMIPPLIPYLYTFYSAVPTDLI